MEKSKAHRRFARWAKERGSQRALCALLDVSPAFVSDLCAGKKYPGRALANAIERASASWKSGPIRSEEWDAAEAAAVRASTRAA